MCSSESLFPTFVKQNGLSLFKQTEVNMEELDLPTDHKDLPFRIDWNAELPAHISVPRVDLHSLVLDFSAVSFVDITAVKGLKTVQRHSGAILDF